MKGSLQGLRKAEETEEAPSSANGGAEDGYLSRAFAAAKGGDEAAFTSSLRKAIQLCVQKELAGEYEED